MYVGSNVIIIERNKEGHSEVRGSKAAQGTKGEREKERERIIVATERTEKQMNKVHVKE